jgi:hypothetical protein
MKIALTLIMELADFFILLMWTLKGKLVLISKPKMKAEVETIGAVFGRNKEEAVEIAKKASVFPRKFSRLFWLPV